MPLDAFGLALAAAVLHAGWNVLLRGARDVEAATAAALGLSVVLFAPVAAATWNVHSAAWPYIAASSVFETVYFFLLVAAYRRRELSVVYPVARGLARAPARITGLAQRRQPCGAWPFDQAGEVMSAASAFRSGRSDARCGRT